MWLHPPGCLDKRILKSAWLLVPSLTSPHVMPKQLPDEQQGNGHLARVTQQTQGKPGPPAQAFTLLCGALSQAGEYVHNSRILWT